MKITSRTSTYLFSLKLIRASRGTRLRFGNRWQSGDDVVSSPLIVETGTCGRGTGPRKFWIRIVEERDLDTAGNDNFDRYPSPGMRGSIILAGLLLVCLAFVLLVPLPVLDRGGRSLLDLCHAPAFAIVTFCLCRIVSGIMLRRRWQTTFILVTLMSTIGLALEALQSQTGREFSRHDALANVLGSISGGCWFSRRLVRFSVARVAWSIAALVAIAVPSYRPVMIFVDIARQQAEMPVLASFETEVELSRWLVDDGKVTRTQNHATDGDWALRVELVPGEYPGLMLAWPVHDWSAYDELVFDLYVDAGASGSEIDAADEPAVLILKIEDAAHNGEYDDRFHRGLPLTPGSREIRVSLSDVELAPRDRRFDLSQIARMQLFIHRPTASHTFFLDNVRLQSTIASGMRDAGNRLP